MERDDTNSPAERATKAKQEAAAALLHFARGEASRTQLEAATKELQAASRDLRAACKLASAAKK